MILLCALFIFVSFYIMLQRKCKFMQPKFVLLIFLTIYLSFVALYMGYHNFQIFLLLISVAVFLVMRLLRRWSSYYEK